MVGGADVSLQYPVLQELGRGRRNSGAGNVGLVTHRLAQAHRPRCRMLAFIPWTAGSRIDPIVGWMGIYHQRSPSRIHSRQETQEMRWFAHSRATHTELTKLGEPATCRLLFYSIARCSRVEA